MSKIDRDVIRHLERLAHIELSPDEVEPMTQQLSRIVAMVERLQRADVTGVEPTHSMAHEDSRIDLRDDAVTPSLDRDTVLKQAPDATGEFFRVPRVITRGEEP